MEKSRAKAVLFWPIIATVVVLDIITKALAVRLLVPQRIPHEVFGDVVRLTLVYNRGAAFGLHVGEHSRWIFLVLTVLALVILYRLYRDTRPGDRLRTVAIALVCAGAIGNLIDRVRSPMGVVDFLDIGVGALRWPTFNVADIAVSIGAFLLAWALWGEDARAPAAAPQAARVPTAKPSEGA
jgi:signal peptidase II